VVLDGSGDADRTVDEAVKICRADHAQLTMLAVISPPPAFATFAEALNVSTWVYLADLETEVLDGMRRAVDRVPADLPVTTIMMRGRIAPTLNSHLAGSSHDLLVIGPRRQRVARARLLPRSNYGLKRCAITVLIVQAEAGQVAGDERSYLWIHPGRASSEARTRGGGVRVTGEGSSEPWFPPHPEATGAESQLDARGA
jgi:hypothetical protein